MASMRKGTCKIIRTPNGRRKLCRLMTGRVVFRGLGTGVGGRRKSASRRKKKSSVASALAGMKPGQCRWANRGEQLICVPEGATRPEWRSATRKARKPSRPATSYPGSRAGK